MSRRIQLQTLLQTLIGGRPDGKQNVFFQPPATIKMVYPCIVYSRSSGTTLFADNEPYKHTLRYSLSVIDPNPDSDIPSKVAKLPMCTFDRHYTADNLHHDVFNLYF